MLYCGSLPLILGYRGGLSKKASPLLLGDLAGVVPEDSRAFPWFLVSRCFDRGRVGISDTFITYFLI